MIKEYRRKVNLTLGCGVISQAIGFLLSYHIHIGVVLWLSALFIYGGIVLIIRGLWFYAKSKGYSGLWGLLGLLSIFGLIILIFFPDKHKN